MRLLANAKPKIETATPNLVEVFQAQKLRSYHALLLHFFDITLPKTNYLPVKRDMRIRQTPQLGLELRPTARRVCSDSTGF